MQFASSDNEVTTSWKVIIVAGEDVEVVEVDDDALLLYCATIIHLKTSHSGVWGSPCRRRKMALSSVKMTFISVNQWHAFSKTLI
jgi:hypothetical protein